MLLIISSKDSYATKRLMEEAQILNVELRIMDVEELVAANFEFDIGNYNTLYVRNPYLNGSPKYLSEIIKLAKKFKGAGKKVVDANLTSSGIGQGKWIDYVQLLNNHLLIPKTILASLSTLNASHYPLIVKWTYGFRGQNVFLVRNEAELGKILKKYPRDELIVQEYIDADYEYKIITVGYESLPKIIRFKIMNSGFRIDHTKSEILQAEDFPEVVGLAEKSAQTLGRELSKVDILEKNGCLYVLEVNRFPGFENYEHLTGLNIAQYFIDYLLKNPFK